ncbi:MAG: glycosyltransferase family 4 protein [Thomasclavelia sp.]
MKILIITNHSYMLYQFRKELISKLLEKNKVVLVMPFVGHEQDFKEMGCTCIPVEMKRRSINPFSDLKLLKDYKKILLEQKPDKVITYSIKPNIYSGILCRHYKIPYYANVQGLGSAFERKTLAKCVSVLYKRALKYAKKVFFENQSNANIFTDRNLINLNQACVLHGAGVNLNHYCFEELPDSNQIHYIFIGRIMKEKGIDEIFYAAKKMKEKYGDKVIFDFVGFFEDEYKEMVTDLSNKGIIKYHGFQEDVRPYLKMSHCLLLPSYHEGMANTILEASAMGRAVIASNIPGCKEGILDGKSGYLVKVKNENSLFEKIEEFYQLSFSQKQKMGITARKFMEKEFDKTSVVEATYKELML